MKKYRINIYGILDHIFDVQVKKMVRMGDDKEFSFRYKHEWYNT